MATHKLLLIYTVKNYRLFQVVENRMQQGCGGNIAPGCQQYC